MPMDTNVESRAVIGLAFRILIPIHQALTPMADFFTGRSRRAASPGHAACERVVCGMPCGQNTRPTLNPSDSWYIHAFARREFRPIMLQSQNIVRNLVAWQERRANPPGGRGRLPVKRCGELSTRTDFPASSRGMSRRRSESAPARPHPSLPRRS